MPRSPELPSGLPPKTNEPLPLMQRSDFLGRIAATISNGSMRNYAESWKDLPPSTQRELRAHALAHLRETKPQNHDRAGQMEWHAVAKFLQTMDPTEYQSIAALDTAQTKLTLNNIEQDFGHGPSGPLSVHHIANRMDDLYKVLGMQASPEGKALCLERLQRWEDTIGRMPSKQIDAFIDREIGNEHERESHRAINRPTLQAVLDGAMESDDGTKKQSDSLRKKFRKEGTSYLFDSQRTDRTIRSWAVDVQDADSPLLRFRSTDPSEPGLVFTVEFVDGLDDLRAHPERIDAAAARAVQEYEQERGAKQAKTLQEYDLPKDRPTTYLRIFPPDYDSIVQKGLVTSSVLSATLRQRDRSISVQPPIFSETPKSDLSRVIASMLETQKRDDLHFCIDVFSHGNRAEFEFPDALTAADVVDIARAFPRCTFTINTIACYGGGVIAGLESNEAFTKDAGLQERLAAFTQSKGDVPNLPGSGKIVTTYYAHFMRAMRQGKSYGEAHRTADEATKEILPTDGEALIHGKKMTLNSQKTPESLV